MLSDSNEDDESNVIGTTIPNADHGDPDCCGCLNGIVRGNQAEIVCNECRSGRWQSRGR